ncbi:MAG TPA: PAS domain-containing protein [Actinomycetes bacterium]|nr:PAS domain-containing protein [Actinomycetes bacterium]
MSDLPPWVGSVQTVCAAIAALLHPHAEVALHDLATDTIVGLWNPLSGRRVGEPSLLEELPESWQQRPVQGPYRKLLADGRELGAVSAVVHDAGGNPRGLLCINLDRTPLLDLAALLAEVAAPVQAPPAELFARDWREQISLAVDELCREHGLDRRRLTRADRRALVAQLDQRGLFATRNAAEHASRALGVSRATVYTLLKEARRERDAAQLPA